MTINVQQPGDGYRWLLHVIENACDDSGLQQPEAFPQTLYGALETSDDREHGGQR